MNLKKTIIILSVFITYFASAQSCEILITGELPICNGEFVVLSVEESDTLKYLWVPGGDTTAAIVADPQETTKYFVEVYNDNCYCRDSVIIEVYPVINVVFDQIQKTCTGIDADCQGQVMAIASGAFEPEEYLYFWNTQFVDPGDSSLALGLCGDISYSIRIEDTNGCYIDTSYIVESFRSPVINIFTDPDSVVYIEKPMITFSFENLSSDSLLVTNYEWDFGDSITSTESNPTHIFDRIDSYNVMLNITDENGCDTTYFQFVEVKPVKLIIPNVFTPNGDGKNDTFAITEDKGDTGNDPSMLLNIYYISNKLVILNRWGKKVFETNDYQNDWDGGNNSNGVYFYVLECHGQFSDDVFKGSITIIGKY
ncbi:MAG: gliding motility-associated C-terminal domain-containing protein [Bacteroidales bacterium]|nr:gliding motility-associated C-terminal domain-containing protein [Bacteroidales bacterium]